MCPGDGVDGSPHYAKRSGDRVRSLGTGRVSILEAATVLQQLDAVARAVNELQDKPIGGCETCLPGELRPAAAQRQRKIDFGSFHPQPHLVSDSHDAKHAAERSKGPIGRDRRENGSRCEGRRKERVSSSVRPDQIVDRATVKRDATKSRLYTLPVPSGS